MKKPILLLCFILTGAFALAQRGFAIRAAWLNGINEIKLPSKELEGIQNPAYHYSFEEKIACRAEVLYRFPTGLFGKLGLEYRQYYFLNNSHLYVPTPDPSLSRFPDMARWNISYLGATAGLGYDYKLSDNFRLYGNFTYHLLNKIWEKETSVYFTGKEGSSMHLRQQGIKHAFSLGLGTVVHLNRHFGFTAETAFLLAPKFVNYYFSNQVVSSDDVKYFMINLGLEYRLFERN